MWLLISDICHNRQSEGDRVKSTVSKKELLYFNFKQIMRTCSLYTIFGDMEILLRTHKFRNLNYDMSNTAISNNVSYFVQSTLS